MKLAATFCIIVVSISAAMAVRCYECINCSTVSASDLKDCGTSSNQCAKEVINNVVSRSCLSNIPTYLPGIAFDDTCQKATFQGLSGEACFCTGDGCNGSTRAYSKVLLSLVLSGIVSYFLL